MRDMKHDDSSDTASATAIDEVTEPSRYLFCLVPLDEESESLDLDVTGIEDRRVYLITADDIGVVVQECNELYDSEDFDEVRHWLLDHQEVVDAAGERFGTPLPFRFDTILTGDDAAVRSWVSSNAGEIRQSLSSFQGFWEYRIHLTWDPEALTSLLLETDNELQRLHPEADNATGGTGYLREKQFEQKLQSAKQARKETVEQRLSNTLDDLARDVEAVKRPRIRELDDNGRPSPFAGFSVLADDAAVDAIGGYLDDIASMAGLEVTFTGPWPPYTFAPAIGEKP